jgi:hypothetical protein
MPEQTPQQITNANLATIRDFLELTRRYGIIVFIPLLIMGWAFRENHFSEREELHERRQMDLHTQNLNCREEITKEVKALSAAQFALMKELYETKEQSRLNENKIDEALDYLKKQRR